MSALPSATFSARLGRRAGQADVGHDELVAGMAREHRDRRLAARGRARDLRRHGRAEEARAEVHVPVIGGAHEHAGAHASRRRGAGDGRPALDQALERAEAAGRLDELVEAIARGDRRRAVDGRRARTRAPGGLVRAPALVHHDGVEREPLGPARGLEARAHRALVGPADAEVGDRVDAGRDPEQRPQVGRLVEAHPADAEPLRARCEPEVLDRAGRAVDVGLGDRPAPEDLGVVVAVVAAEADAERRLHDALDLLIEEVAGALVEAIGLAQALALGEPADLDARVERLDDDHPPRLHETDGRRAVSGLEQQAQGRLRNRVGAEAPDVAPLGDHAVHGRGRGGVVAPAAWIGGALAGARGIEARRSGRSRLAIGLWHAGHGTWAGEVPEPPASQRERSLSQQPQASAAMAAPQRQTALQPPVVQASDPSAEPIAPPLKFAVV
jgi:hypothetical protein